MAADFTAVPANTGLWDASARRSHGLACQTVRKKVSEVISQRRDVIRGLSCKTLYLTRRIISLSVRRTRVDSAGSSRLSVTFSHRQPSEARSSLSPIFLWHN